MINSGINISCYGCGVCAAACPCNAISMQISTDGFWVPVINTQVCVECGICEKVCSFVYGSPQFPNDRLSALEYKAVWHKNTEIRRISTSGGAGYAIASFLNKAGYRLVGVKYDLIKNIACHFVTDSIDDFVAAINSKYLPSYTLDGFSNLMNGDKYAVFGTPCQIDSIRRWARLRKKEENFVFIDLFCHGVPSYLHWKSYLNYYLTDGEKLVKPVFRDKINGWHNYTMSLQTNKRKVSNSFQSNDLFQNLFLGNYTLNLPCYTCKYRLDMSAADIRMGDFWGRKYFADEKGVTGVLILTQIGKRVIDGISDSCHIENETSETLFEGQLAKSISIPPSRRHILNSLRNYKSLLYIYIRYASKMWMKNFIPYKIKTCMKFLLLKIKGK